jgi:hypothetical protein
MRMCGGWGIERCGWKEICAVGLIRKLILGERDVGWRVS